MEKRCIPRGDDRRWAACREVLSNGLRVNPDAPPLLQAWGLLEMQVGWVGWGAGWRRGLGGAAGRPPGCRAQPQRVCAPGAASHAPHPRPAMPTPTQRGNRIAALLLLDRSARLEPRNRPVLRWAPVIEARRELNASRFARLRAARSGGSAAEQS